jgi:hypothetical protein
VCTDAPHVVGLREGDGVLQRPIFCARHHQAARKAGPKGHVQGPQLKDLECLAGTCTDALTWLERNGTDDAHVPLTVRSLINMLRGDDDTCTTNTSVTDVSSYDVEGYREGEGKRCGGCGFVGRRMLVKHDR